MFSKKTTSLATSFLPTLAAIGKLIRDLSNLVQTVLCKDGTLYRIFFSFVTVTLMVLSDVVLRNCSVTES